MLRYWRAPGLYHSSVGIGERRALGDFHADSGGSLGAINPAFNTAVSQRVLQLLKNLNRFSPSLQQAGFFIKMERCEHAVVC